MMIEFVYPMKEKRVLMEDHLAIYMLTYLLENTVFLLERVVIFFAVFPQVIQQLYSVEWLKYQL